MPRSKNVKSKPRRRSVKRSKPRQSRYTHTKSINSLEQLPELINKIGNPQELVQKITNLQKLSHIELKERLSKIDRQIKKAKTTEERTNLCRDRIGVITALIA